MRNKIPIKNWCKDNALLLFVSFCLATPLVIFNAQVYDISLTFLLLPLGIWGLVKTWSKLSFLFIGAFIAGIASILLAEHFVPKSEVFRNVASLCLIFITAIFFFLGKYISQKYDLQKIVFWSSIFSSAFICIIAIRVLVLGQSVRIYTGINSDYAEMNASFLGLKVFGTFGVISLADLILIQVFIVCSALFLSRNNSVISYLFLIPLLLGIYLVWGSESRADQLLICWVLVSCVIYFIRTKSNGRKVVFSVLAIFMGISLTFISGNAAHRLESSIVNISVSTPQPSADANQSIVPTSGLIPSALSDQSKTSLSDSEFKQIDSISTGRFGLAKKAVEEFSASPLFGNGFYGYDRSLRDISTAENSSTHIYYLTLLWKGGVIFFLVFGLFLFFAFYEAFKSKAKSTNFIFFISSGVLLAFGPLALTWDILAVPSAGALAFYLLGILSNSRVAPENTSSSM